MANSSSRLRFGVAAYSFPFSCGLLRHPDRPPPARPIDAWGLIDLAQEQGLSGVELPLGLLPDLEPSTVDRLRATLEGHRLKLVVDTPVIDVATIERLLPLAARAGARVVRAMLSSILEGARATLPGGWDAYLAEMRGRIDALLPLLAEYDLVLALENHQDATSDELLALCEAGGGRVGVTFDVVNPLAVGEEPFAFARKLGPWIRNVHLKDYRIHTTSSGYRLVRAALGQGVIDWPAMLALLGEVAPDASLNIELAALYARHIRLLEDEWWQGYPPRDARALVPTLRLVARHARPADEPWQTPWERAASDSEVSRYEHDQFVESVRYLRSLEP